MKDSMLYTMLMHAWAVAIALNTQAVWLPMFVAIFCGVAAVVNYLHGR